MLKKVILVIFDGLGDRPVKSLGFSTPLEAAKKPNIDKIAYESECGIVYTLGRGFRPGSDVSHLSIMGYDPETYYCGRGPIEVAGLGLNLRPGDIAFRGNLSTVDDDFNILDRRAGRILDVSPFTELIDGLEVEDVKFIVKPGTAHRAGVIMRGKDLSAAITDVDPHEENKPVQKILPKDESPEAARTAEILELFLQQSHEILKSCDTNKKRIDAGETPANFLLLRGPGQYRDVPPFETRWGLSASCVAGGGLYKGIGSFLGMDVIQVDGATGLPNTNVEAKLKCALEEIQSHDFVFVHIKATDSLGEDGEPEKKCAFIEKADLAFKLFHDLPEDVLLIITSDHSTPSELKAHSADPVPILFHGSGVRRDEVSSFGERSCAQGSLGVMEGRDILPQIQNLLGRLHLIGA